MNSSQKFLSTSLLALFASAAFAAEAPPLDTAAPFAVLGAAVSTTGASITGNVGSSGAVTFTNSTIIGNVVHTGALTNTDSTISGTITTPLNPQVVVDFEEAYLALDQACTQTIVPAAFTGVPLTVDSGVICFGAAVTFTNSVLTLRGNGPWIFRVGTTAAGALTGTNLTMIMANGGDACDVFWQVNAATTLTTSVFRGTILAGAAITTTGGTIAGRALARAAVTMTGTTVIGCDSALPGTTACKPKKHHKHKHKHKKGHGHDDDDDDGDHHDDDDDGDHRDDDDKWGKKKNTWGSLFGKSKRD
jgi:hypothetical protein